MDPRKEGFVNYGFNEEVTSSQEDIAGRRHSSDLSGGLHKNYGSTSFKRDSLTNEISQTFSINSSRKNSTRSGIIHSDNPNEFAIQAKGKYGNSTQPSPDGNNRSLFEASKSERKHQDLENCYGADVSDHQTTGINAQAPNTRKLSSPEMSSRELTYAYGGGRTTDDSRSSKDYYRDIQLSIDVTKSLDHRSKNSNIPFKTSIDSNSNEKSFPSYPSPDNRETKSSCCNCSAKSLERYRIILKYFVQRPLFCFTLWAMLYIYWDDEALPGGSLFALVILELSALFLGYVAELLELPGLLGMAAAGLILRNVPHINVAKDLALSVSGPFRGLSIVILLIKGASGVNPVNIIKFKRMIPPLVIGSCVAEAIAASIAIYFLLDFPWEWALLMGCIISAMSSAAVGPYVIKTETMFSSKEDDGLRSPNYSTVLATAKTACGLDAMISICLAEVALGFIFAEGDIGKGIVKGFLEVVLGGVAGTVWGLLVGFLLDETSTNEKRCSAVFACGVMSLIGFPKIGYGRAGPLAVFVGVLLSTSIWKKKEIGGANNEQLTATFTLAWYVFQPLLFSLICARIDFEVVDWSVVWKGLICLLISLTIRFCTTFFMTTSSGEFTVKERLYMCIAWIPKGTVQAALGPAALDTVLSSENLKSPEAYEDLGNHIMNLSAVSFIVPALIGCLCLRFIGPKLLTR